MTVPQHAGKHRSTPVVRAIEFQRYVARRTGTPLPRAPRSVVMVFGARWSEYLAHRYGRTLDARSDVYRVRPGVGIAHVSGPGAPHAGIVVEELAALGAKRFVAFGLAGALQPDLEAGSLVLCERALRDEGTSHHYARPGRFALPSGPLTERIASALRHRGAEFRRGGSWTMDSPYRETLAELRRYRRMGLLTVEMEASAIFTIARHHRLQAAALFVVSDRLSDEGWELRFHDTRAPLRRYLEVVLAALAP